MCMQELRVIYSTTRMPGVVHKNGLTIGGITYYVLDVYIQRDLDMNTILVSKKIE